MVTTSSLRHEALLYTSADEFVDRLAPFVRDGVDAGEPVFVLLPPDHLELLQSAVGRVADGVFYADMTRVGHNPARLIPAWQDFVATRAPSEPARGIGEPMYAGRSDAERAECHLHEALVNVALANEPLWLVCPYDTRVTDPVDVDWARRNHPETDDVVVLDIARRGAATEWFAANLPEPARADRFEFELDSLREMRQIVAEAARAFGCSEMRIDECVLAVSEIATNSLMYGGAHGTLRTWTDEERLVCEISDRGHITEPMIGRVRPAAEQHGGRGLWLANQLADLVQARSNGQGTVVRLHIERGR